MNMLRLAPVLLSAVQLIASGQAAPGTIDGAKNPELIPDNVAFRVMFLMISDGTAPMSRSARLGYMEKAFLTEKQVDIVIDAANHYRIVTNAATRKGVQAKPKAPVTKEAESLFLAEWSRLQADVDRQLAGILRALETDLGQDDYGKLLHFVRTKVKAETTYGKQ